MLRGLHAQAHVSEEFAQLDAAYRACDLPPTYDESRTVVVQALRKIYTPGEFGDADAERNPRFRNLYDSIGAHLESGIKAKDENALELGYHLGRTMAAAMDTGTLEAEPIVHIGRKHITVADMPDRLPIKFGKDGGRIVDFGMGVNGLVAHLDGLKRKRFNVVGLVKDLGERAVLLGIAQYNDVDEQVEFEEGIVAGTDQLLRDDQHTTDVVIASRVHMAGRELLGGLKRVPALLRVGGVIVAYGPSQVPKSQGVGYDKVATQLRTMPGLSVILDNAKQPTDEQLQQGFIAGRCVVAQRKET